MFRDPKPACRRCMLILYVQENRSSGARCSCFMCRMRQSSAERLQEASAEAVIRQDETAETESAAIVAPEEANKKLRALKAVLHNIKNLERKVHVLISQGYKGYVSNLPCAMLLQGAAGEAPGGISRGRGAPE